MSCPKCGGKLYLEDDERYSGDEGYVVMCYDCPWIDKYLYSISDKGYERLKELQHSTTVSEEAQ